MERLTFEGNFCETAKCAEIPGGSFCENGACSQKEVWERLKAYEDTGLSPEDAMILSALVQCGACAHSRPLNRADPNEDICVDGCLWCQFHERGVFPEEFCSDGILSEECGAALSAVKGSVSDGNCEMPTWQEGLPRARMERW